MSTWRDEALAALQWHWGGAYEVTEASGVWRAVRRDTGRTLVATAPEGLRDEILTDYTAHPVSQQFRDEKTPDD